LEAAGSSAEGAVVTYPYDPERTDAKWRQFRALYRESYGEEPDATAAYAYDGTSFLLEAIREAGLNRVLIRDRLFSPRSFEGVTGTIQFDQTQNNVSPVVLGRVRNGVFVFEESRSQELAEVAR
jgi:branched-chain amino acid transport system substrate-binding protein